MREGDAPTAPNTAATAPPAAESGGDRPTSKNVRSLRALAPFLAPHWRLALAALASLMASAALTLSLPTALRRVVDLEAGGAGPLIDQYFLALIGLALALAVFTATRFYFISRLGERVVADIRRAAYDRAVGLSPQFFETIRTGETLSRLTTDTTVIQSIVGSASSIALRNIILFFGASTMMLLTSPKLTGLAFLIVPAVVVPIVVLGRRLRRLSRLAQDEIARASASAGETLGALRDVQAFTWEDRARAVFADAAEGAYDAAHRRIVARSLLTAIVIFLIFGAVAGVLWVGWRDMLAERISPGELTQFLLYAVFTAGSVGALSEIWSQLQQAAGASERLAELLNADSPVCNPAAPVALPEPPVGAVAFEGVSFRYPARPDAAALIDFSLTVRPGETVALVGPSGAGKTTVLHLLQRFYDPEAGVVRVDGVDVKTADLTAVRRRMAVAPQDPVILAASVADNIRFGRPEADDAAVRAAAEAAAAHGFVSALPRGYDTLVGERGLLSGGQRQRIAIARAILRDAPILLLDEATSSLDAESERAVQEAVERLSATRTTLVIAHRLATVKRADRIVVIDQGRIVAEGTHDALNAQGGLYARLAALQFS